MMDVKSFLKANKLKQVDLAKYLGVSDVAVSNVVNGKSSFSDTNMKKLLSNPYGWDTSMLTKAAHVGDNRVTARIAGNSTNISYGSDECAMLREQIRNLERLLEEKERLIGVLLDRK